MLAGDFVPCSARLKMPLIAELLAKSIDMRSKLFRQPKLNLQLARTSSASGCIAHSPKGSRSIRTYRSLCVCAFGQVLERLLGKHPARRMLKERHRERRFDLVLIYNMQRAQIGCALYAIRKAWAPVVLQYEDDSVRRCVRAGTSGLTANTIATRAGNC